MGSAPVRRVPDPRADSARPAPHEGCGPERCLARRGSESRGSPYAGRSGQMPVLWSGINPIVLVGIRTPSAQHRRAFRALSGLLGVESDVTSGGRGVDRSGCSIAIVSRRQILGGLAAGAGIATLGASWGTPSRRRGRRGRREPSRPIGVSARGTGRIPKLPEGVDTLPEIEHIIVLMMENHSYDNYLGTLGRGDGFTRGRGTASRVNSSPDRHGGRIQAFRHALHVSARRTCRARAGTRVISRSARHESQRRVRARVRSGRDGLLHG